MIITVKEYEKPGTGAYIGVLADIVDLGMVPGKFGLKPKVRLVWILNAKDTEGNYFRVMAHDTASMHEKSKLYKHVYEILNAPVPEDYELDNLIGKCSQLVIRQTSAVDTKGKIKIYANVESILPLPAGVAPFAVPQGFIRKKDQQNQNGTQTSAPATAQTQALAAAPVAAVQQEVADEDIPF